MNTHKITKEKLIQDLLVLGVKPGDHLGVGLSYKSIGNIEGGAKTLIEALVESVGEYGTIMMPVFTRMFPLYKLKFGKVDYVFDYRETKGTTGFIPDYLRKQPGAVRSKHPTNSIVAIGGMADFLTTEHDEKATAYMPYSRLADINGKTLSIGIGDKLVGIRHEAQFLAGLLDIVPYKLGVHYRDDKGTLKTFVRKDKGGCITRLPKLVDVLRKAGKVNDGKVGNAKSVLVFSKDVLEIMSKMLKTSPQLNLCDDIACLWCREIERRLNLYDEIEEPKIFQRNWAVVKCVSLYNRIRLLI